MRPALDPPSSRSEHRKDRRAGRGCGEQIQFELGLKLDYWLRNVEAGKRYWLRYAGAEDAIWIWQYEPASVSFYLECFPRSNSQGCEGATPDDTSDENGYHPSIVLPASDIVAFEVVS